MPFDESLLEPVNAPAKKGFDESLLEPVDQPKAEPGAALQPSAMGAGGYLKALGSGALAGVSFSPSQILGTVEGGIEGAASLIAGRPLALRPEFKLSEAMTRPVSKSLGLGPIPEIPTTKETPLLGKLGAGVVNAGVEFANFAQSPEFASLFGLGGLSKAARELILKAWGAGMSIHAPARLNAAIEAGKQGDWATAAKETAGGIAEAGIGGKLFEHGLGQPELMKVPTLAETKALAEPTSEQALAEIERRGTPPPIPAVERRFVEGATVPDYDPEDIGAKEWIRRKVESGITREQAVKDHADAITEVGKIIDALPPGTRIRSRHNKRLFENVGTAEKADWHEVVNEETGHIHPLSIELGWNLRGGTIERLGGPKKNLIGSEQPAAPAAQTEVPNVPETGKIEEGVPVQREGIDAQREAAEAGPRDSLQPAATDVPAQGEVAEVAEAAKPLAAVTGKEPWQMTRETFAKQPEPDYPATYRIELDAVANGEKPAHYGFYPVGQNWSKKVYQYAKELGLYVKKGPRKNDYIVTPNNDSGIARAETIYTHVNDAVSDPSLENDILWHDRFGKLLGYGPEFEGKIIAISGPKELENARLHRYYVAKAIREGKPVPHEVLADYPDLAQQASPELPGEAPEGQAPEAAKVSEAEVAGAVTPATPPAKETISTTASKAQGVEKKPWEPNAEQWEQLHDLKAHFPYRRIFAAFNENTGEFRALAETSIRRPNLLVKQGWEVHELTSRTGGPKGRTFGRLVGTPSSGERLSSQPAAPTGPIYGQPAGPSKLSETSAESVHAGSAPLSSPEAPKPAEPAAKPAYASLDDIDAAMQKGELTANQAAKERDKFLKAQGQTPPAEEAPTGVQAADVSDWTSATDDAAPAKPIKPKAGKPPVINPPTELHAGIPLPKFANRTMSPLDQVTTSHSAKLQKSFDEARRAQREIKAEVPSERRQNAISIWREAKGDLATLQTWASAAKGKLFRQAATDAQILTPKEIAVATRTGKAFDVLEQRGNKFDVLRSHRDAYVPHVWDVKKTGTGWGGGMLKQRFRFSKARTFDTFFDGDQAGFKPKTLAIGKLLPAYIHEMNRVIADRQAVRDFAQGLNADGSPMAVPRGNAKPVEGDEGKAVLVQPRAMREADTSDYRVMPDQPALANWTWASKDTAGNPVFIKSDLALHPDAYRRLNAMIGQSAIRTWYHDPVSGTAQIPRAIVRGLDVAQAAMKREMFGLLAPFHQVQEGTHGIGHMVNPFFNIPKIDLRDAGQFDAANHGLMLMPDRASARVYLEGVGTKSSFFSQGLRQAGRLGKIGKPMEALSDVIDGYQDYLFHQYIPGLKYKTYQAMLGRNMKLYAEELKSGAMTVDDVKITSAEQANAAYGHLNYALLDRNPTMQHLLQIVTLAPDFLEARSRFVGQAIKGLSSDVGHEQLKAIAILAAVQAGSAFVIANSLGGSWDPKHPFEVIHNGRRYAMRSVPEDIYSLLKDTRQFIYGRVNPLTVKGAIQFGTGLNYRGEKVTPLDTFTELLAGYIPITARQLPGLRSLTETSRRNPVSPLQQLAGSMGLRISRYSPISETYKLATKWKESKKMPVDTGSYPISKYQQLRYALEDGDLDRAKDEYNALLKTMPAGKIQMGFRQSVLHPFTGKLSTDAEFAKTLKGYDLQLYIQAKETRKNILTGFSHIASSSGLQRAGGLERVK